MQALSKTPLPAEIVMDKRMPMLATEMDMRGALAFRNEKREIVAAVQMVVPFITYTPIGIRRFEAGCWLVAPNRGERYGASAAMFAATHHTIGGMREG